MGRINLSALRVRQRALGNQQVNKNAPLPIWADVIGNVPPAQIMTRQQPIPHPLTQTRTKSLPDGKTKQVTETISIPRSKSYKPSKLFSPVRLRYEEDTLRKQFFSDHPWELARPRVVLETTGDSHASADWSTGLLQPGIPLSGESVVQRQKYLLENTPDLSVEEAYDTVRKEFYTLRRRQATNRRVAVEEAEMLGADFGVPSMAKAMSIEDKMHDNWLKWANQQGMEIAARNAAFSGQQMQSEKKVLGENARREGIPPGSDSPVPPGRNPIGAALGIGQNRAPLLAAEERRRSNSSVNV